MIQKISELKRISALERMAASLSRLWQHATQEEYPIGILTAFRGKYSRVQNLRRNQNLAEDLKSLGYGFIPIQGHYIEGHGTEHAKDVNEESFFVVGKDSDSEAFKNNLLSLGEKYSQDSILYKAGDSKQAVLVGTLDVNEEGKQVLPGKGQEVSLGEFHPQKIDMFYSKWKNKTFVFASLGHEYSGKSGIALRYMERDNDKENK